MNIFPKLDLSTTRIFRNNDKDIIEAMSLIGQEVYVSDVENFEFYQKLELSGSKKVKGSPFCYVARTDDGINFGYKYFILAKDVKFVEEKPKEKVLRPYKNVNEFLNKVGIKIGDVITIKRINCKNEYEDTILFIGFRITKTENQKYVSVLLGQLNYTFEDLMNNYLYYKDGKWEPFGILIDEND